MPGLSTADYRDPEVWARLSSMLASHDDKATYADAAPFDECACCGKWLAGANFALRTRGHLRPKSIDPGRVVPETVRHLAHDPSLPCRSRRFWVWQCRGCNQSQNNMTMRQWSVMLRASGDRRASRVLDLLVRLRGLGLVDNDM